MQRWSAALGFAVIVAVATSCGGGEAAFRSTASTTVGPSQPSSTSTTVPKGRTVPVGAAFSVTLGETVSVPGAGASVTFTAVVSDNRCRPGRMCIVAGKAVVAVQVTQAGLAPADIVFDTDGPTSARYGNHTVELVGLSFGLPPVAMLKVT